MICIGRLSYGRCWSLFLYRNGAKLDVTLSKAPDLEPPSPRMGKHMRWVGLGWFLGMFGVNIIRKGKMEKIDGNSELFQVVIQKFPRDSGLFQMECLIDSRYLMLGSQKQRQAGGQEPHCHHVLRQRTKGILMEERGPVFFVSAEV